MRFSGLLTFLAFQLFLLGFVYPASAGTITFVNGQSVWQSTQCPLPSTPTTLLPSSADNRSQDANGTLSDYNQYVQASQAYMNCVSAEAQRDAESSSDAIIHAGQAVIADMQKNVTMAGATLLSK